jgi:hypothetical protein
MTTYRKPNGKTTASGRAYCLAWRREINLPLEKHYNLTVMAFDPDVMVKARGTDSRPASIPLWLAKRMVAVAKAASSVPKTGTIKPKMETPL